MVDINKFISNQMAAWERNNLIGMLADAGHALVQTGLQVNGVRYQGVPVGPLLMDAASLRPGDRLHKKEEMTEMANSGKGVRIPMRTRGRQRRHKPRLCRCCGREMEPTQIWICASCEAAGRTVPRARGVQSGAELLAIARAREAAEEPILEGWGLDEIEALARYLWNNGAKAYGSYGKLRGWCDNVGRLPPLPEGL